MSTHHSDLPHPLSDDGESAPKTQSRRRDRRHAQHDQTRLDILEAAWAIARRDGVATVSLRGLARDVGIQPQSLYTYVDSKNALFDAMFAQATRELIELLDTVEAGTPEQRLRRGSALFVRRCTEDPARFLLVFQSSVPGFSPSADSMALAFALLGRFTTALGDVGVTEPAAVDLFTAAITGLISQQISNDPGGDRWTKLLDRLITALLDA